MDVESLVVEREDLLRDVIAHQQREDLSDVAVLREQQIQFLSSPRHVPAPVICT